MIRARNRRLLFRSYLVLAGSLLVVAVVLDIGFGQLHAGEDAKTDRWLMATFQLIVSQLEDVPVADRAAVVRDISEALGTGIELMASDEVVGRKPLENRPMPLVDPQGNTLYLYQAESLDVIVRLGPLDESRESLMLNLLPPAFYLSIFIVVGLWLRPLLRDINVISTGAQRFAADYRNLPAAADKTSELTPLAQNLDEMAARLSGVLRSQKELIAALSHEMRTPLARIRFALAIADDKAQVEVKEKLRSIKDDVQEIDDLVGTMLNYARLDHPDIEMHWQDVPIANWMDKVIMKAPAGRIDIKKETGTALDTVHMDPHLMELALSNLLVNATKYAVDRVHCIAAEDAGDFVLSVEDDGQGIPEDQRESVFKAFTRIDDSRNRDTGGHGLGLAIVARVAALHGGHVNADISPTLGGARITIRWRSAGA